MWIEFDNLCLDLEENGVIGDTAKESIEIEVNYILDNKRVIKEFKKEDELKNVINCILATQKEFKYELDQKIKNKLLLLEIYTK